MRLPLLLVLLAALISSASAQGTTSANVKQVAVENTGGLSLAEVQKRRGLLFHRMLVRPDDLDTAFEYAALSVRAGDLEAAISTLERMLIFAPGLPRLQPGGHDGNPPLRQSGRRYRRGNHATAGSDSNRDRGCLGHWQGHCR